MHVVLKMITGTFCSRILGFLRDVVFFAILGSSLETSAFLIAFAIPNLFRRLCGEGALNSAFIPIFSQRYIKNTKTAGYFLNLFFTRFGVYLSFSVVVGMFLLAVTHKYVSSEKWTTVLYLTNLMLPYLWFICTAALLNGALNVLNAYSLSAFSPVFLNLSTLTGLFLCTFSKKPMQQVSIISICVVVGGFLQWILPKMQLSRKGYPINQFIWGSDPDLTRIWYLFLPSILGAAIFQINAMLGRFFAYSLDERAVSFLYLANRFLELPLGLFAFTIISILLPKLSLLTAQKDVFRSQQLLSNGINLMLLLLVPAAMGLFCLAEPLTDLCFCWGRFSLQDTQAIVPLLKIFAIGLPLFGLTSLLTRVFYAHSNTKTPVKLAMVTLIVYVACIFAFVPFFNVNSLALASVVSSLGQLFLQIKLINQKYPHYQLTYRSLFQDKWICWLSYFIILMCACPFIQWTHNKWDDAINLASAIFVFFFTYLGLVLLLNKESFKQLITLHIEPSE